MGFTLKGKDSEKRQQFDASFYRENRTTKTEESRVRFQFNTSAVSLGTVEDNYGFYVPGNLESDDRGRSGRR